MSLRSKAIQLVITGRNLTGKMVNGVIGGLGRVTKSIFSLKSVMTGLFVGAGGSLLAKSFIDAARETENYQVRLKVLLGSQKEGNELFKKMADYAGRVPFTYNEIMGSATQLAGIMKGGVQEITRWMPLIGDLAAASGLGIRETTEQVSRMLSAGAASADLFRERGILSMLGFKAGVSYSAEETRKKLWEEWNKAGSQFKGATDDMAKTWDGLTSMLSDAWFSFRTAVMGSGVFDGMKNAIKGVIDKINELKKSGKFDELAKGFGDKIMTGLIAVLRSLPAIVRGAIKAAEMLVLAFSGFKQIKAVVDLMLANAAVWSANFINGLRGVFLTLLQAVDRIPGVDTSKEQTSYKNDIRMGDLRIGTLNKEVEQAQIKLGRLQISQDETSDSFNQMADSASAAVKQITDGALKGMEEAHKVLAESSKKSTDSQIADNKRLVSSFDEVIAKYNEINRIKLSGSGGTYSTVESLANALDDEADK